MTFTTVIFHDDVVEDIDRHIAAFEPERGGALLGPLGEPVVSLFVPDHEAYATSVTYTPSQRLRDAIRVIEQQHPYLELKGIIHSHPQSLDRPSGGDHDAYADSLRNSPWLGRFICPIVTHRGGGPLGPHEILLTGARMSVYVAEARHDGRPEVVRADTRVLPVTADSRRIAVLVGGRPPGAPGQLDVEGAGYASVSIAAARTDYTLLFPRNYPAVPPIILRTVAGHTSPIALTWHPDADSDERFAAIAGALAVDGPRSRPDSTGRDGITERLGGIVSDRIQAARVLVVGAGSGGSLTVEALARAGVEHFALVDPDIVEPANLSRSVYTLADVGQPKVEALARRVTAINPLAHVETHDTDVADLGLEQLRAAITSADIVIAATDDPDAQLLLNREAWHADRPAVFAGVYARGRAGEVLFTVPGATRCYRCATAGRGATTRTGVQKDYGTGQLRAEPALGADIAHLVTISTKIAIGLIEFGDDAATDVESAALVMKAIVDKTTFVIASMTHEFDFFPRVFSETPSQLAYQSVWLEVSGDDDCTVCGTHPVEVDVDWAPIDVTAIRDLVGLPAVDVAPDLALTLTEVREEQEHAKLDAPELDLLLDRDHSLAPAPVPPKAGSRIGDLFAIIIDRFRRVRE